jgi:hypothetical protein
MTLGSVPSQARPPNSHSATSGCRAAVNRPLQERSRVSDPRVVAVRTQDQGLASASCHQTRPRDSGRLDYATLWSPAQSRLITICSMIKVGSVISSRASLAAPSGSPDHVL